MSTETITQLLQKAIDSREQLFDAEHETAFRLFNGFTEGNPHLSLDLYAGSVIFHNYHSDATAGMALVHEGIEFVQHHPRLSNWLHAGIVKSRHSTSQDDRRGKLLFGTSPDRKIKEHGVWYAIDLTMNRDASFYLDTRHLRKWLMDNMKNKSVLNAFAYTGSFGVAALAGGAGRVVQLDRNGQFLHLAKDSYALNGFSIRKSDFLTDDFFPAVSKLKRSDTTFDCVLIDPPFFSSTAKGRVDQEADSARLINKVRPLIRDGGYLVAINNALYVSGREFMQTLDLLCKDGYLKIEELIPVPEDFVGYHRTSTQITDPTPFNHSTKIAVLRVKRKITS
ncbi:MAG TPA: class I SAM-dependent methyltransferase [Anaerolineales bacterium]|nr:class I SAM-dependent methyltransferase [Anaerolineales bacterium]